MGEWGLSRRQAALGAVAGGLALLNAVQAQAFLGIGEPSQEEVYKADTVLPPFAPWAPPTCQVHVRAASRGDESEAADLRVPFLRPMS